MPIYIILATHIKRLNQVYVLFLLTLILGVIRVELVDGVPDSSLEFGGRGRARARLGLVFGEHVQSAVFVLRKGNFPLFV